MATTFTLTLDTTAPAGVDITINSGAAAATTRDVTAAITTSDGSTSGYQMKIWGDVDTANDADVQATEGASNWISFAASKAIRLSTGDGVKTLNVKIRDDVLNESAADSDTITLDTSAPVPNITSGPTPTKISKIAGARVATFTWSVPEAIQAYKVKVVSSTNDLHTAGTQIGTTNGSTNMSGGTVASSTPVTSTIDGRDLEAASAGDGAKVVKLFVQDNQGNWSVAA